MKISEATSGVTASRTDKFPIARLGIDLPLYLEVGDVEGLITKRPPHVITSASTGIGYTGTIVAGTTADTVVDGQVMQDGSSHYMGIASINMWVPVGDMSFDPTLPPYIIGSNNEDYVFIDDSAATVDVACFIFIPSNNPDANLSSCAADCLTANSNIIHGQRLEINGAFCSSSYGVFVMSGEFSRHNTNRNYPIALVGGGAPNFHWLEPRRELGLRCYRADIGSGSPWMRYVGITGDGVVTSASVGSLFADGWGNEAAYNQYGQLTRYTLSESEYNALLALIAAHQ